MGFGKIIFIAPFWERIYTKILPFPFGYTNGYTDIQFGFFDTF